MAASVSGSKTVTTSVSPAMSATLLTSLLATAPEALTLAQLKILVQATQRGPFGSNPAATVGSCLP
jgi:hypothetical protein